MDLNSLPPRGQGWLPAGQSTPLAATLGAVGLQEWPAGTVLHFADQQIVATVDGATAHWVVSAAQRAALTDLQVPFRVTVPSGDGDISVLAGWLYPVSATASAAQTTQSLGTVVLGVPGVSVESVTASGDDLIFGLSDGTDQTVPIPTPPTVAAAVTDAQAAQAGAENARDEAAVAVIAAESARDQASSAAQALIGQGARGDIAPAFTRKGAVLTLSDQHMVAGQAAASSMYWPWIIDARAALGTSAFDEYYLYYSTDHAASHDVSGIWLSTGPTPMGPWTGRGRVYRDDAGGTQTETPSVIIDPTGASKLIMLYQQAAVSGAVGGQTTLYATSDDGITWTRGGIAIDIPSWWPSDGHTGYARPTQVGSGFICHSLAGGWNYPTFGRSISYDGRQWALDQAPLAYEIDMLGDGRRMEWNHANIVRWKGRWWVIGLASTWVSGTTPGDMRIIVGRVDDNFRRLIAPPKTILYPTVGTESTNIRSVNVFAGRDGELYLYWMDGTAQTIWAAKTGA